jgi:hypothetical protein
MFTLRVSAGAERSHLARFLPLPSHLPPSLDRVALGVDKTSVGFLGSTRKA